MGWAVSIKRWNVGLLIQGSKETCFVFGAALTSGGVIMKTLFKSVVTICCAVSMLFFLGISSNLAHAVHDATAPGLELDGNSFSNGQDDWNTVWNGGGAPDPGNAFVTSGIVPDTDMYVFRKGSKDVRDIDQWRFEIGSSPPKNDIEHAYCSAYNQSGDLVIYCGANRAVTNGTATTAFWIFGNNVTADEVAGDFGASIHAVGDLYIAVDHDNGGKIGEIAVFEWDGSALIEIGRSANLLGTPGTFCMDVNTGDALGHDVCATTNDQSINVPWDSPTAQNPGAFIEIGVDITAVSPSLDCVSSAMATDRASTSIQAQTKNFLLFPFNVCGIDVTKSCKSPVLINPTTLRYTIEGMVSNTGFGQVTNVTLADNPAITAGTSFAAFACDAMGLPTGTTTGNFPVASLGANSDVCYRATFDSTSNGPSDTVTATASAGGTTLSETATAMCPLFTPTTGISVTKECDTKLTLNVSNITLKVDYKGKVSNLSDVPLTNVTVYESHDPDDDTAAEIVSNGVVVTGTGAISLAKKNDSGDMANYNDSYVPDSSSITVAALGQDPTDPECALFKDRVVAVGKLPAILGGGFVTSMPTEAMCKLCPNGICPVPAP